MSLKFDAKNSIGLKPSVEKPYYRVEGGAKLEGEISISGAKNAALPAIVAACLSKEDVLLSNVPLGLNDVKLQIDLLRSMGATIIEVDDDSIVCNGKNWNGGILDREKASKIRHSLLLLGASIRWKKEIILPLPGGCSIGERKHDLHVSGLSNLGNIVKENKQQIEVIPSTKDEKVIIDFHYPTFGGTLNILFAAVINENRRIVMIKNAARNPEVYDVINLLNKMGANIKWLNGTTLQITGVQVLNGCNHYVMGDRIIAATFIAAAGLTKGNIFIKGTNSNVLETEINTWKKSGLYIADTSEGLEVKWQKPLQSIDVVTEAYPGFHTDIQPLHTVLMSTSIGTSRVKETILDGRFKYCHELNKLGADIHVVDGDFKCVNGAQGQIAIITGVKKLYGAKVSATDIRGGAAVVLAALVSEGTTIIENIYQIERGYSELPEKLSSLGASIDRVC